MKILYKLTTKGRPQLANRALQSIYKRSKEKDNLYIVTCDDDDPTAKEIYAKLIFTGHHKNKVEAINNHIPIKGWDILVNISDDQYFFVEGFDEIIRNEFIKGCRGTDAVLHLPDNNRADLMTMSIIGYDYYQRDKYIYHPSYEGQFCDDEAQQVANLRGCLLKSDELVFIHDHPNYNSNIVRDASYRKYDQLFSKDQKNFETRLANNFYL